MDCPIPLKKCPRRIRELYSPARSYQRLCPTISQHGRIHPICKKKREDMANKKHLGVIRANFRQRRAPRPHLLAIVASSHWAGSGYRMEVHGREATPVVLWSRATSSTISRKLPSEGRKRRQARPLSRLIASCHGGQGVVSKIQTGKRLKKNFNRE